MSLGYKEPTLVKGGKVVDDRGSLSFINEFTLENFKRFYLVHNHERGFIRAWHGHKNEAKGIVAVRGSIVVGAVKMSNEINPDKSQAPERFVLSSDTPSILIVPSGYANGFKTLSEDALVLIFSSSTLDESKDDDYRFSYDYCNIWDIEPR